MKHSEGTFASGNSLELFEQCWRPDANSKAAVVIVHGYAEHGSRYASTAEYLVHAGYAVYTFDLPGHGKSNGTRALIHSFDDYLSALDQFMARVKKIEPEKKIFLLGHSMGGTISVLYALTMKPSINGIILSGVFLKIPPNISPFFLILLSLVSLLFPKLPVIQKLDSRLMSHDQNIIASYDSDPLIYHGKMLARTASELNRAVKRVQARMGDFTLAVLIMHGTSDHVASSTGARELHTRAASTDKTLKLYRGFYHEILNESDNSAVMADMVAWLDARVMSCTLNPTP